MLRITALAAALIPLPICLALADSSEYFQTQTGNNNTIELSQSGALNFARQIQNGDFNRANAEQGLETSSRIVQRQTGAGTSFDKQNVADSVQSLGNENSANLTQEGSGNTGVTWQELAQRSSAVI